MLLEQQKTNVRRHLRYEAIGLYSTDVAGGNLGSGNDRYRWFQMYGQLEYRLNRFSPAEECRLVGNAFGAIGFSGQQSAISPTAGNTITITLTGPFANPVVVTYTVQAGDTFLNICAALSNLLGANADFITAGFYSIADYGTGPYANQVIAFPITSIVGPTAFTIVLTHVGTTVAQIVNNGSLLPPSYTCNSIPASLISGYLPICDALETAWLSAGGNLSIQATQTVKMRLSELSDREKLYNRWCAKMAEFIGIPFDPMNNGRMGDGLRRVM